MGWLLRLLMQEVVEFLIRRAVLALASQAATSLSRRFSPVLA